MTGSPTRHLPSYAEIKRLREGTGDGKGMTLQAIGDRYGVSRQAVLRAIDRGEMHETAEQEREAPNE
jgi:DNA-directed RNA polymerase sigma subunit (sigma70/sigma32)